MFKPLFKLEDEEFNLKQAYLEIDRINRKVKNLRTQQQSLENEISLAITRRAALQENINKYKPLNSAAKSAVKAMRQGATLIVRPYNVRPNIFLQASDGSMLFRSNESVFTALMDAGMIMNSLNTFYRWGNYKLTPYGKKREIET